MGCWGKEIKWEVIANGHSVPLEGDEDAQKLDFHSCTTL